MVVPARIFKVPERTIFRKKIFNQRLKSKAFKIEALKQRHQCIRIRTWKAPEVIKTGFEFAIKVGLYAASYETINLVRHKLSLTRPRPWAPRVKFFLNMLQIYTYETLEAHLAIQYILFSRYWGIQVLNGCTCTDFEGLWTDHFSIKIYNQRLKSKAF